MQALVGMVVFWRVMGSKQPPATPKQPQTTSKFLWGGGGAGGEVNRSPTKEPFKGPRVTSGFVKAVLTIAGYILNVGFSVVGSKR